MVFQPIKYVTPGELIAAGIVLPVLAAITVFLRFYARTRQEAKIGIDDWLIALGLLTFIGMGVQVVYGAEKHVLAYNTPRVEYSTMEEALTGIVPEIVLAGKLLYAFEILMMACYGFTKTSIIFFYRRIFVVEHKATFSLLTIALLALTACWSLGFLFSYAFECGTHFSAAWGSAQDTITYCNTGQGLEKGMAISDLILDIIIIAVPIPYVWKLQMPLARKLAVSGILLVGLVAIGASIGRLTIYLLEFSEGANPNRDRDQTITAAMYWVMIEAGLSVIAASLPSLRFLFGSKSPRTWLASARSAFSLHTLYSSGSRSRSEIRKASIPTSEKHLAQGSLSSRERIAGDQALTTETTVSTNAHESKENKNMAIYVQKSIEHENAV